MAVALPRLDADPTAVGLLVVALASPGLVAFARALFVGRRRVARDGGEDRARSARDVGSAR